jgi:hypothetical protein
MEITNQTCAYRIQSLSSSYTSKELEDCRLRCNGLNKDCINYISIERSEQPFRIGSIRFKLSLLEV